MITPLAAKIRALIAADGPMPVATFFQLCLADPEHGYYRTRDPLRVLHEVEDWTPHPPEAVQTMLQSLARLRAEGRDVILD